MGAANREECFKRTDGGGEDPDDPAEAAAAEERDAGYQLDHPDDDRDPSPGVQGREGELRFVGPEVRVSDRGDPVDEVEDPCDQQQDPDE